MPVGEETVSVAKKPLVADQGVRTLDAGKSVRLAMPWLMMNDELVVWFGPVF
jgi:hypothetical protein